ncbi:6-O-methylguanine DNA methyltransferase [Hyaloraphidium curvatum]|nr:6-O-methylguanine DNA methyltransferase [Hyaloraphidium curvatum]
MLVFRTLTIDAPSSAAKAVGPVLAAATPAGIAFLRFGDAPASAAALEKFAKKHGMPAPAPAKGSGSPAGAHLDALERALGEFFDPAAPRKGELSDAVELDLHGSETDKKVWRGLCTIPEGEAWTYGQLAEKLGLCGRAAARSVGQANNRNPVAIVVPCHRVVAASHMGGYAGPPDASNRANLLRKEALLRLEFARAGKKEMPHTVAGLERALKGSKKGGKGKASKVEKGGEEVGVAA